MHTNTIRALERLAKEHYVEIEVCVDDEVSVASEITDPIEVHRLEDGRWIIAQYSKLHSQWQSSDHRSPWQGYRYTFAARLSALPENGIRTYRSPVEALKSFLSRD